MKALCTEQGIAAGETFLCNECYLDEANQAYAREMASQSDDVNPNSDFVDCSENHASNCCICGRDIFDESEGY